MNEQVKLYGCGEVAALAGLTRVGVWERLDTLPPRLGLVDGKPRYWLECQLPEVVRQLGVRGNHRPRVDGETARHIRDLAAIGFTDAEIAGMLGIARPSVRYWRRKVNGPGVRG